MDEVTIILASLAGLPPWVVLVALAQFFGRARSILRWGGPHGR